MDGNTLLIVDDDPGLRTQIKWALKGYQILMAGDRASAVEQVRLHRPAVVTMDLGLPPSPDTPAEGLAAIAEILRLAPRTQVIAVTGQSDEANAIAAIECGAFDFFAKPFDSHTLRVLVDRAFGIARLRQAVAAEAEPRPPGSMAQGDAGSFCPQAELTEPVPGLLTGDESMRTLCGQLLRVAASDASVLLIGESGTGKELLARALHTGSPKRSKGRFVAINCAAIPESLLEAELFGHERGTFTGAVASRAGRIEAADGGTLFLDEIGDLPLALQPKLLRFLQERKFERVGGRREIAVDTRIVCATHRRLRALAVEGSFREDLFYRIAELELHIPPLRQRGDDAMALAGILASRAAKELGRPPPRFTSDAMGALRSHPWPGNVRELQNAVKRAVLLAEDDLIRATDLTPSTDAKVEGSAAGAAGESLNLRQMDEAARRRAVMTAMARSDGNISKAAKLLGVSRPTMYDMLRRYGLR